MPMLTPARFWLAAGAVAAIVGVVAWLPSAPPNDGKLVAATVSADMQRGQEIAFYERRLREDPHSALDMGQLAALLMDEGRMNGDERTFSQAEALARKSLGERTQRNGRSAALLTSALLAQHRFAEADSIARDLVHAEPEHPAYRALVAETAMELGDYDHAIRHLGAIRVRREDLGIAPRFARWSELTGRPGEARRILQRARDDAKLRGDLTGEQRAWFSLRLADMELRHGNLRSAESAISDGLRESPGDWRLILARARLESARTHWGQVIASAEEVLTRVSSPDALALLATAHRELGHDSDAKAFEVALEQVALSKPGVVHRSWATALLDSRRDDATLISMAAADTLVRHDIHTLDLLAWALYRFGRAREALPIMRRAMALGSTEASLRYHAAMIEFAGGDAQLGDDHARIALSHRNALTTTQISELRHAGRN
jgi:tetratricopeptide (TPR) repeat protein